MKCFFIIVISYFFSSMALAGVPTCHSSYGGYCQYLGKVKNIYVNTSNTILIYFDTPVSPSVPADIGLTITNGGAAAFNVTDNPEFAKLFYSTALSAQATGRDINIQMRGTLGGYLKFDRIWLAAP